MLRAPHGQCDEQKHIHMTGHKWILEWLELSTGAVQPHALLCLSLLSLRLPEEEKKLFI